MPSNDVLIIGDSSALHVRARNVTGVDPLEFINGSFRSCPEERRVCVIFLNIAGKVFELRVEITSPVFVEHTVTGQPTYKNEDL